MHWLDKGFLTRHVGLEFGVWQLMGVTMGINFLGSRFALGQVIMEGLREYSFVYFTEAH